MKVQERSYSGRKQPTNSGYLEVARTRRSGVPWQQLNLKTPPDQAGA
jgi:hypothetical protein